MKLVSWFFILVMVMIMLKLNSSKPNITCIVKLIVLYTKKWNLILSKKFTKYNQVWKYKCTLFYSLLILLYKTKSCMVELMAHIFYYICHTKMNHTCN
jgi:hypothetical protein